LPVYLPRRGNTYEAHVLQEIPYDRAALRDAAVRQQLTQEIVTAFEPVIQQHIEQWYQFIPLWHKEERDRVPAPQQAAQDQLPASTLIKDQIPTSKLQ